MALGAPANRAIGDPDRGNTGSVKDFLLGTVAGVLDVVSEGRFGLIQPLASIQAVPGEMRAPVFSPMATIAIAGLTALLAAGAFYLLARRGRR